MITAITVITVYRNYGNYCSNLGTVITEVMTALPNTQLENNLINQLKKPCANVGTERGAERRTNSRPEDFQHPCMASNVRNLHTLRTHNGQ